MPENDRELEQNSLYRILPPDLKKDLSDAEKLILKKALTGEFADCKDLDKKTKKTYDVEKPDDWPESRNVSAKFLEWLLRDREAIELVHDKGVRIKQVRIHERLDLECIQIPFPLAINYSRLENGVSLFMAKIQPVYFWNSFVKGINAEKILVEGTMHLDNIISNGNINLNGADIGGSLICTRAKFRNRGKNSFSGDSMIVKGNVFLTNCKSIGKFHIVGSDIGGNLQCNGAKFINIRSDSFSGDSMIAKGEVFLEDIISIGIFRFVNAHIGGDLYNSGSIFMNKDKTALIFVQTKIEGRLCLDEIKKIDGFLDLRGTKAGALRDDEKSWPDKGKLILDGFEYDAMVEKSPRDAKSRLKWLDLQIPVKKKSKKTEEPDEKKPEKTEEPDKKPEEPYEYKFSPQPYEHLARLFRKMGKRADANTVLLKKERLRRKHVVKNWLEKLWGLLLDATIGYGYRVGRALIIVAAFIILGTAIFGDAYCQNSLLSLYEKKENTSSPKFNAFIYSIDTFVPFLDLHQEKYWEPYGTFTTYYWIHIIMGWVFTTLLAAKFTGLIRRE